MDERGKNQRGITRAKDPARYPLACRLVDLTDGCGSILYGRTTQGRAVYTCGRYMRTSCAECTSNQVDAEAMLRFTLKTLKQLVDRHGRLEKLRQKLLVRARRTEEQPLCDPRRAELGGLQCRQTDLQEQRDAIEYRMGRESDDLLYAALSRQYKAVVAELEAAAATIGRLEAEQTIVQAQAPEQQVEAALALLDDIGRITTDPQRRGAINGLLQRLGVRIGLQFVSTVKGKKRQVQQLVSGRLVFGDAPLPVPLFGKDNLEGPLPGRAGARITQPSEVADGGAELEQPSSEATTVIHAGTNEKMVDSLGENQTAEAGVVPDLAAGKGDRTPAWLDQSQPEGISTTKVSRELSRPIGLFLAGVAEWEPHVVRLVLAA